jgi:hypothetical protein
MRYESGHTNYKIAQYKEEIDFKGVISMPRKPKQIDPTAKKLEDLEILLQDILIIQCALAGIKKAEARKIVSVSDARVTRIWKHIKVKPEN